MHKLLTFNKLLFWLIFSQTVLSAPVSISSDKVKLEQGVAIIYNGNATISKDDKLIKADKIIVKNEQGQLKSVEIIGSTNKPAFLAITSKPTVNAWATKITYNPNSKIIILQGDVKLISNKNTITADHITINTKTKAITAKSKTKQVVTEFGAD